MKTKYKIIVNTVCLILLALLYSCKKQDAFLNEKPVASLSTIATLSDCQLLLQNEGVLNQNDPALGEMSTDDFYLLSSSFNSLNTVPEKNSFIWAKTIYAAGVSDPDFTDAYNIAYIANTILDALPNIPVSANQQTLSNTIKGTALFFRAIAFYNVVQTFAMPYDSVSATTELGVPLPLTSDVNAKVTRASEGDCYNQIINDLITAANLLPANTLYVTAPSQTAAYGALARVFLGMSSYGNALKYANLCLSQNSQLTDYNTIVPTTISLIARSKFFPEDIFHTSLLTYGEIRTAFSAITDSTLFNSYGNNDLRKSLFFVIKNGLPYFRGTYDNRGSCYSGIATDEIYLVRAECNARIGNTGTAMTDLNTLLSKRWKTGTFIPFTATSADNALQQILLERRKELIFRGLRWTDLRRLNKESRFAITLTRVINGTTYTLPPNDPRYAFPFPDPEIQLTGIPQNQR